MSSEELDGQNDSNGDSLTLIGEGNRHYVFALHDKVFRAQKDIDANTLANCEGSLRFFDSFLSIFFDGFICSQRIAALPRGMCPLSEAPLYCIETVNLLSEFTVELKPKCAEVEVEGFPPRFVLQQKVLGDPVVFNPAALFDPNASLEEVSESLHRAMEHKKRYLKIHSRPHGISDDGVIRLLAISVFSQVGRDLMNRLKQLCQCGTDKFAKISRHLLETDVCDVSSSGPIMFFEEMNQEMKAVLPVRRSDFIRSFLAGRMAMDVSLFFNFSRTSARISGLRSCRVDDTWSVCIGVVDTELKHAWKIKEYACQMDTLIEKFRNY